ncbi:disrupted in schizophrenia 1 protein [Pteronotus mesoamericanus]|uniref:disrupted in schizophrenia 1 protein n=1 Tax=Pteronotus mesoamericanus TaxID=1884717 RepID=UPI0023ECEC32|nr:disrupted in schizophrenia 1 protein [Pteronotus parnellii mesoamericanus]
MPGGGPRGAPAGGGGGPRAGNQDCLPPAVSFRRRRLARKPGYMRSEAGPQIRFLAPAAGTPFRAQGGACSEESHHSEPRAGRCGLDPGGQWRGPLVGSLLPRSTAASAGTCVDRRSLGLAPARGTPGFCGIQFRAGAKVSSRLARWCGPGGQGELPPMDSSEAPGPHQNAACSEGARGTWTEGCLSPEEVSGSSCSLGSGPKAPSAPAGSQAAFTSSFSFIQLSLSAAGERGEAEGCPPFREAENAEAKAASLDRPREDPRLFSPRFDLKAADSARAAAGSPGLEGELLSVLDAGAVSCCSPDPSGFEGAALPWDPLLRRCEPLLLDCLLSNRRQLEVNSLRLKLQKLQEKAVEDEDYDKAETLKQRLEDLEKEKSSLHFQLPSRQPALRSLLVYLGAQAEAALRRAAQHLQERIKPLTLSLKEITAKVCRTEKLCSTLRKKVNEIETQMSALLEAKMLAVSGHHFGTAKELTEEIRSLTSEREGLEGLLHKLSLLSSRNVRKLGSVREDYSRLRRDLDHGKTAHETSVKEKAVKYMDALVDRLRSCTCPLLGKVWEADLEACQLLLQSLQPQEASGSPSADEEQQMDGSGGAAGTAAPGLCPRPRCEEERRNPLQALEEWRAPPAPSPPCADSEQKEESYILSAELGEKCEAIGKKLLCLEDQLHVAIQSHDEDLIQCLRRELQMVKETLQAMIPQLQPAKEAGEKEAAVASCATAGVRAAQA